MYVHIREMVGFVTKVSMLPLLNSLTRLIVGEMSLDVVSADKMTSDENDMLPKQMMWGCAAIKYLKVFMPQKKMSLKIHQVSMLLEIAAVKYDVCKCVYVHASLLWGGRYQGILKGKVSLYCWPPVWLVRNQLYDNWQFLFLFGKQTNPNESNRRSMVQWYFPL